MAELENARLQFLKKNAENLFVGDYSLEMDETPALEQDLASWYQFLIGVLSCMVEIGIVDIITKVLMMVSHMAMPMEGHLEAVLHVFAFLHQKYNSSMAFDPIYPAINMSGFKECK